ncbi:MAG: U32 family peptidase, partial [Nanoarchaeota archaeon]
YFVKDEEGKELKIENNQIFSAKDLCTLPFIDKMKKAGIISFKIEGRNRDARYVDTVVKIYRKALDKKLSKKEIDEGLKELEIIYNKGYSSGFYLGTPTADDFSKVQSNASAERKHFVGKVVHYFDDAKVAAIKLVSELNVGDKIVIIGDTTGIVKTKIDSIEINKKEISNAGKEVGIKVPEIVRKNDEVYVLKS